LTNNQTASTETGCVQNDAEDHGHEDTAQLVGGHEHCIGSIQGGDLVDLISNLPACVHLDLDALHEFDVHVDATVALAQADQNHARGDAQQQHFYITRQPHGGEHQLPRGLADPAHEYKVSVVDRVLHRQSMVYILMVVDFIDLIVIVIVILISQVFVVVLFHLH